MSPLEHRFLLNAGRGTGAFFHLDESDRERLSVEVFSDEALRTSAIEGEILDRASVQSSIMRQLGLTYDRRRIPPAEAGIAELIIDVYRTTAKPLSESMLFRWHRMLALTRIADVGKFRTGNDLMQIVSGRIGAEKVHFEAPPSAQVSSEMNRYIEWFNSMISGTGLALLALTRAGIAHLYFESIHPFEDGNGRIGRALAEKALSMAVGQPLIAGLASEIFEKRKSYYAALEKANREMDISQWLTWFAQIVLDAQQHTLEKIEFLIAKSKLLDRLRDQLNARQQKALLRLLEAGPKGFEGGLSAGNYGKITGASPATTTRDLADMVQKGALIRKGERKHARYSANLAALE